MRLPLLKVQCVGEVTPWGRTFIDALARAQLVELKFETPEQFNQSVDSLVNPFPPPVIFIENCADSRAILQKLRERERPFYFIWYGRSFTKEDFLFALEARAYAIFESLKPEDPYVTETLKQLSRHIESFGQFTQVTNSLRNVIMQVDTTEEFAPLLAELKTVVAKLEKTYLADELLGAVSDHWLGSEKRVALQSQGLSEALMAVEDFERTGQLWVRGSLPKQEGRIEFIQGKIVSAVAGEVRGLKAIYRMFLWDEPRLFFSRQNAKECTLDEELEISIRYLCLEGKELKRRFEAIRAEIPPEELCLALEPNSLHTGTRLAEDEFFTLASVVEFGRVGELLDYNGLPDTNLYEALIRLRKQNMIRVVT